MLLEFAFILAAVLIVYHHVGYPVLLRIFARRARVPATAWGADVPVALVVPAHNEAAFIIDKLNNIAGLDYDRTLLRVVVVCDGCTDETVARAQSWVALSKPSDLRVELVEHLDNRGKVAVLNEAIALCDETLVALSDVSAELEPDALRRAVAHFRDAHVGFVTGKYELCAKAAAGEAVYWRYQTQLKHNEAQLGAPMGAHGAFYVMRRDYWSPLEADTINDDFVSPMRIVAQGLRGVYDPRIIIRERDGNDAVQDFARRLRIAAGNVQQIARVFKLADPARPGLAFVFLSGKALRASVPFLMLVCLGANAWLALDDVAWRFVLLAQVFVYLAAGYGWALGLAAPHGLGALGYLLAGHVAGLVGGSRYMLGSEASAWRRAKDDRLQVGNYVHPLARLGKRVLDIACGLGAMVALIFLFVPIALAIKLDSRGPVFYRQMRVGRATPRATELFWLSKFRTMRTDAEKMTGAVWAATDDPRVTRVGRFLRKTRLDELPQAWNVLRGDMSVVGPRPERPQFFQRLEGAIPFYIERTYGLKPGITGLAQVSQGYDSSIEDVRSKVLYDHVYALRISQPLQWLVTDVSIILRTFSVMVLGKGQ